MADSPSDTTTQLVDTTTQGQQNTTGDTNITAATPDADTGAQPAEPISLDQVIQATIDKGRAQAADSQSDGNTETSAETGEAATGTDGQQQNEPDEDANVPFHKHPRWQQIKTQRNEARAKAAELEKRFSEEFEPLKQKADNLDQIGTFMRDNGLTPQELSEGFQVMALMKNDPAAALQMLLPKIELLELATGKRLPSDIRERVESGEVSEAAASELAMARMTAAERQAEAEKARAELEHSTQVARAQELRDAANAQEREISSKDPDFQHKRPFVIDRFRVLAAETPPRSKADVNALIQRAYDDINASMRALVKPQPTQPIVTSGQSTTRTTPQPKTLEDIVRANISR
jgi:hypothetical protein